MTSFRARMCLLGVSKTKFYIRPHSSQKTEIWGQFSTGLFETPTISRERCLSRSNMSVHCGNQQHKAHSQWCSVIALSCDADGDSSLLRALQSVNLAAAAAADNVMFATYSPTHARVGRLYTITVVVQHTLTTSLPRNRSNQRCSIYHFFPAKSLNTRLSYTDNSASLFVPPVFRWQFLCG